MNVFTNTKKFKKFIIVLVFLMLFNFSCPQTVKAGWDLEEKMLTGAANLFFGIFDGILKIANRIFLGDKTTTSADDQEEVIYLTPENIIKGKFLLMDANIFRDISGDSTDYIDTRLSTGVKDRKNSFKKNYFWLVLCVKKFGYCCITFCFSICSNKNDIIVSIF